MEEGGDLRRVVLAFTLKESVRLLGFLDHYMSILLRHLKPFLPAMQK